MAMLGRICIRHSLALTLLVSSNVLLGWPQGSPSDQTSDGQLSIVSSTTTLGVGESAQLTVKLRRPNLEVVDVTDEETGTKYITTDESMVIPEPDGRITCVGTQGKDFEQTDVAAVHGKIRSWIGVRLQSNGPGPTLEIVPEKATLHEGESIHFRVVDKNQSDMTRRSSGTRYLVFKGYGVPDSKVIRIDDEAGTLTALDSLGKYQSLHPIIFVRNGDLVGWIVLKIGRKGPSKTAP
jgi:hypothetical protein